MLMYQQQQMPQHAILILSAKRKLSRRSRKTSQNEIPNRGWMGLWISNANHIGQLMISLHVRGNRPYSKGRKPCELTHTPGLTTASGYPEKLCTRSNMHSAESKEPYQPRRTSLLFFAYPEECMCSGIFPSIVAWSCTNNRGLFPCKSGSAGGAGAAVSDARSSRVAPVVTQPRNHNCLLSTKPKITKHLCAARISGS